MVNDSKKFGFLKPKQAIILPEKYYHIKSKKKRDFLPKKALYWVLLLSKSSNFIRTGLSTLLQLVI
jgi:hypothetical protein